MNVTGVTDIRPKILAAMEAAGGGIDMSHFTEDGDVWEGSHPCGTVCCLAGWVINCHPEAREMVLGIAGKNDNAYYGAGYDEIAERILEASGETVPDFYDTGSNYDETRIAANERAMNWLRTGVQA